MLKKVDTQTLLSTLREDSRSGDRDNLREGLSSLSGTTVPFFHTGVQATPFSSARTGRFAI